MTDTDPTTIARRLELALKETYADGWSFYDRETRERLAADHARVQLPSFIEAVRRAGLALKDEANG